MLIVVTFIIFGSIGFFEVCFIAKWLSETFYLGNHDLNDTFFITEHDCGRPGVFLMVNGVYDLIYTIQLISLGWIVCSTYSTPRNVDSYPVGLYVLIILLYIPDICIRLYNMNIYVTLGDECSVSNSTQNLLISTSSIGLILLITGFIIGMTVFCRSVYSRYRKNGSDKEKKLKDKVKEREEEVKRLKREKDDLERQLDESKRVNNALPLAEVGK